MQRDAYKRRPFPAEPQARVLAAPGTSPLGRYGLILMIGLVCALALATLPVMANEADSQDCLNARDVQQFEIISNDMLVLHGKFDKQWVSRLPHACAGLRKNMLLTINRFGSKICANDRFEARDHGPLSLGTSCRLGQFEPVAVEQVIALKQAIEAS